MHIFRIGFRLLFCLAFSYILVEGLIYSGKFHSSDPGVVLRSVAANFWVLFLFCLLFLAVFLVFRKIFKSFKVEMIFCSALAGVFLVGAGFRGKLIAVTYPDLPQVINERLIAHGTGRFKEHSGKNALESLERSYQMGFRFIEIDFRLTKDKQLVGVHKWEEWAEDSGFSGKLPPDFSDFKKFSSNLGYTPLSAEDIREWFQNHPDIVLVSDKLDDADTLIEQFPFKERLYMEVFSLEKYKRAIEVGVAKVFLSESVLYETNDINTHEFLIKNQVKAIVVGKGKLFRETDFFKELKDQGVEINIFSHDTLLDDPNEVCKILSVADQLYIDEILSEISCDK